MFFFGVIFFLAALWGMKDFSFPTWDQGFPGGTMVKTPLCHAGDLRDVGLIPGSGSPDLQFPGVGNCNPLWYSCLETPTDRRVWWAPVHWVTQSQTWLKHLAHSMQPGIESLPPAVEAQSPNHWTAREVAQYLSFSVWLTSLSIMPSKSIHVVANGKILFFFMPQ